MKSMTIKLNKYNRELGEVNEELQELPADRLVKRGTHYQHAINENKLALQKHT